jgi:hypothetical protein
VALRGGHRAAYSRQALPTLPGDRTMVRPPMLAARRSASGAVSIVSLGRRQGRPMMWIAPPEQLRYLRRPRCCSAPSASGAAGFGGSSPEPSQLATRCMQRPGMTTGVCCCPRCSEDSSPARNWHRHRASHRSGYSDISPIGSYIETHNSWSNSRIPDFSGSPVTDA